MSERIGVALRRVVAMRARHRCEYCGMPDTATAAPHEPDHVIAVQHGGLTTSDNLAYACFECNRTKGSNIASHDPNTGKLVPLFHPRKQRWKGHFRWSGALIEPLLMSRKRSKPCDAYRTRNIRRSGLRQVYFSITTSLTATGRATAFFLRLNEPSRVTIRENLQRLGRY